MKSGVFPLMYEMAWRPDTSQIFLYSFADKGQGYTFLVDTDTGNICELNLGGWAVVARWSPNGRYLAIERSQAPDRPIGSTVLTVLDTLTGNLATTEVVPEELPGIRAVQDLTWAPDNRHLLVLGSALSLPQCAPNCHNDKRLYLVDWLSGQIDSILPEYQFTATMDGINLAWSPDGSKVIALCPSLCSISVQKSGQ
jgi:Tol biopolymer transport system component